MIRTCVLIPVYNERENIAELLKIVTSTPGVDDVFVISSSTDDTDEIAHSFDGVTVVHEEERGKTLAMNIGLQLSEVYDYAVFIGGDNLPVGDSLKNLVAYRDNKHSLVSVREIPTDSPETFWGFLTHLQWNIHHEVSMSNPKVSGEMFRMKTNILREMPPAVINDDLYIQHISKMRGHDVKYLRTLGVYLKGVSSFKDFWKQRIRVYIGHHQLRLLLGRVEPTTPKRSMSVLFKSMPLKGLKWYFYVSLFVLMQGLAFACGYFGFHLGYLPYRWDIAESTKRLQYGV